MQCTHPYVCDTKQKFNTRWSWIMLFIIYHWHWSTIILTILTRVHKFEQDVKNVSTTSYTTWFIVFQIFVIAISVECVAYMWACVCVCMLIFCGWFCIYVSLWVHARVVSLYISVWPAVMTAKMLDYVRNFCFVLYRFWSLQNVHQFDLANTLYTIYYTWHQQMIYCIFNSNWKTAQGRKTTSRREVEKCSHHMSRKLTSTIVSRILHY